MRPRLSLTLAALLALAPPLAAQGTAADSAHWRATKVDLDSIARDKTAPAYSKRAQARIRARDSVRTVVAPAPTPTPTPSPVVVVDTTPTPAPVPTPIDTARFDGVAELPRAIPTLPAPSCSTSVRVLAGTDLQAAINSATPGVCLLLAPGATFTTSSGFTLPNKGSATNWVVIQTEATLPPVGTRMTPSRAASLNLARILTSAYAPAIRTATGAHHYIIRGVEVGTTSAAQSTGENMLIDFRDASGTPTLAGIPHDLWLHQVYVHGTPTLDMRRHVFADFRTGGAVDSWFADSHSNSSDSQCWLLLSGGGHQRFQNNHCEAGHELFMSGGGSTPDSTFTPSDVAVLGNHFIRPASWKGVWQAKNLIETKHIRRLLIEGNVMENSWADAQAGFCFVMKSENQNGDNPWTTSSDITVRYNLIRNCASLFNISAFGSNGTPAIAASRYSIHGNKADSVGKFGGDGIAIQNLGPTVDLQYRANSFLNGLQGLYSNQAMSFDGGQAVRLVVDSNVIGHGSYGVKGGGTSDGVSTLTAWAPGAVFTNNAIVGGCGTYPATNACPTTAPLLASELAKLNAAIAGVVVPDGLSLTRPRAISRGALKYPHPTPKPECQSAAKHPITAAACDVPLKP